jgi:hypothetical protein
MRKLHYGLAVGMSVLALCLQLATAYAYDNSPEPGDLYHTGAIEDMGG